MKHSFIHSEETKPPKTKQKHMKQDCQHIDKPAKARQAAKDYKQINGKRKTNISRWHTCKRKALMILYKVLGLIIYQMVHL